MCTPLSRLHKDSSVSGSRFSVAASPSLAHMMRETAEDIPHPTIKGRTLWQARFDSGTLSGPVDPEIQQMYDEEFGQYLNGPEIFENGSPVRSEYVGVSPLGSGSDYTIFLDRIGVCYYCMLTRALAQSFSFNAGGKLPTRIWCYPFGSSVSLPLRFRLTGMAREIRRSWLPQTC